MAGIGASSVSQPEHLARAAAIEIVAVAAATLFKNGQTTERVVIAAERLGRALGVPLTLHPHWGELALQVVGTPFSEMIPTMPLGVDMGKVLATTKVVDQVCDGRLPPTAARSALAAVERLPSASTPRFVLFAAIGAASLGVIFGALDPISLLLIAVSAALGAWLRRWLATLGRNPFVQPLCAAVVAGAVGAVAMRFHLGASQSLVTLCPGMVLVPGPHILNGAIDLARARITLGVARLVHSGLIVLMICAGLLAGLAGGGATLPAATVPGPVPIWADVIAAGCAVAAFGTFFSMPWRLLPFSIALGMLAHAARWALISLAGAHVALGALVACALVGVIVAPVADRLHLPFAAFGFSAVVSLMPGFFLFRASGDLIALISAGAPASPALLSGIVANGTTAFLVILAMTFGLILPRMLFEHFLPTPPWIHGR
ncbi:MAG TPA: threonine/serine exporter family protein [Candidatus Binatia bacterium]|nr:threonine/serine exporter family protein [Candidatus Binatia bacterium]